MEKLEEYSSYKDSGVEWLGAIPSHWEILKSKYFHKNLKKLNTNRICDNVLSLTLRGVVNNDIDSPEGLVPKDYATYQLFEKDDLVFKLIDLENISTSRVGIVHEKGIMSSAYIRIKVGKNSYPKFAYYYYYSLYINQVYNNIGSGVRSTLGPNDLLNIDYIEPPIKEQEKIISFLDNKTQQINNAISQKEKLIEFLKEQKQIIINDAVTKGLNRNVEFLDSGVEWLGTIPSHWEILKVKNIFTLIIDPAPKNNNEELLSIYTDIGVKPRKELEEKGNKASTTDGYWKVKKGDFIVNKLLAWMGAVGISEYNGVTSPAYDILRAKVPIAGNFYHELFRLKVFSEEMKKHSRGIMDMRLRLYFDKFGDIFVPYPSYEEQCQIVEYIDNQASKIDKAIELQKNYISKLKEYKTSLIDSVVTGKVRVV